MSWARFEHYLSFADDTLLLQDLYPGAGSDTPGHIYSLSWAPNPGLKRFYASAADIKEYLGRVASRSEIQPVLRFSHRVREARWLERECQWLIKGVESSTGTHFEDRCHV